MKRPFVGSKQHLVDRVFPVSVASRHFPALDDSVHEASHLCDPARVEPTAPCGANCTTYG